MPRSRRGRRPLRITLLIAGGALLLVAGFWLAGRALSRWQPAAPEIGAPRPVPQTQRIPETEAPQTAPSIETEPAAIGTAVRVAIVIDDLGRSLDEVDRLRELGVPLSYSVLPFEVRTPEVVAHLAAAGVEILCHLPMEARDGANPGPGAIYSEMSARKLRRLTRAALDAVPGATGVNNHMGSRVTADAGAMRTVLEVIERRGLFFIDSRTTAESVAFDLAREAGIPSARRAVFLDADAAGEAVREAFVELIAVARREGAAIGLAHPRPATLRVLAEQVPQALAAGVEFVPVSYLLEQDEEHAD
jgi:polysaccharide deacetylase 2 family uncharacterized protein YibQ